MSGNVSTPAATAALTPLAIAGFRRDETLWPRHGLQRDRVQQFRLLYREGGETAGPPLLVAEVAGRRYLVDGWHRCAAAEEAALLHLPATIRPMARVEDVYLEALALCSASDRPLALTRGEKRAATDHLLRLVPQYSDRCIARLAGVTHPFVGERRRLIEEEGRENGSHPAPTPSRHAAARIVSAALALDRLAGNPRHLHGGEPLDPIEALAEAAQARGAAGTAALARLAQWARRAERRAGGELPGH